MIFDLGSGFAEPPDQSCVNWNSLSRGRYRARCAASPAEMDAVRTFRGTCFDVPTKQENDPIDTACRPVLIETIASGDIVCTFRLRTLEAHEVRHCYASRFYDLSALSDYPGHMLEIGRFCTVGGRNDPDILRLAWAVITRCVDAVGVDLIFGCSSFSGTDPAEYDAAFAYLLTHHRAPDQWAPGRGAAENVDLAAPGLRDEDQTNALRTMPPLLRSYLRMGAWVSAHAVIDRQLDTMHVFTGLEVARISPARKRLLRAL